MTKAPAPASLPRSGPKGAPSKRNRGRRTLRGADQETEIYDWLVPSSPNSWCINWECASNEAVLLRKEVIQPHLPVRLPCYDFTPITDPTFDSSLLAVGPLASGVTDFRGVTGGVYKARERIHPGVLIRDY